MKHIWVAALVLPMLASCATHAPVRHKSIFKPGVHLRSDTYDPNFKEPPVQPAYKRSCKVVGLDPATMAFSKRKLCW